MAGAAGVRGQGGGQRRAVGQTSRTAAVAAAVDGWNCERALHNRQAGVVSSVSMCVSECV